MGVTAFASCDCGVPMLPTAWVVLLAVIAVVGSAIATMAARRRLRREVGEHVGGEAAPQVERLQAGQVAPDVTSGGAGAAPGIRRR